MPPTNREARVLDLQINRSMPVPTGLEQGQSLLIPPAALIKRLAHFAEEVYNVEPESVISRWMKVILGDAGAGYLRKKVFITRLQESLSGTHFFDLDRFYGALFAVGRRNSESLAFDPYTDLATWDEWEQVHILDASYRSRVEQFARALNLGATPAGIEGVAEALLAVDVDIFEDYYRADRVGNTWDDLEADFPLYSDIDGEIYDSLEGGDGDLDNTDRFHFRVTPKRPITLEEQYALVRAISRFRPAFTNFSVDIGGIDAYNQVPIQAAWSDSEYWEVRRQVIPTPGTDADYGITTADLADNGRAEPRRPPFTDYQGEAWSYASDVLGLSSYILKTMPITPGSNDNADTMIEGVPITLTDIWERIVHNDRSWTDYTEDLAVRSIEETIAGRAASDGILLSHTYMSRTDKGVPVQFGESGTPAAFPSLYVDRARIDAALDRVDEATRSSNFHYWSTPPQNQDNSASEVLEVRFRDDKLVNYLTFEAPRFPHAGFVQFLNARTGTWKTMYSYVVAESFPQRVISRVEPHAKSHPQHDFAGHWQKFAAYVDEPIVAGRFRIVMQRGPYGAAPVNHRLTPLPYSLGLRRLDLGYRVRSREDVPNYAVQPPAGWANTRDVLGSRVYFDLRTRPGTNVLDDTTSAWWSEPMPIAEAVASLHLDVRDDLGAPQVIDRFWIEPATEGVPFNVYWSDGELADGPFEGSDTPIDYPKVTLGSAETQGSGLIIPANESVTVNNSAVQFDPTRRWWIGLRARPASNSTDKTDLGLFYDDPTTGPPSGITLSIENDELTATVVRNGAVLSVPTMDVSFNAQDTITVALAYEPATRELSIYYKHATDAEISILTTVLDDPITNPATKILLGTQSTAGAYTLQSLTIKQGVSFDDATAQDFFATAPTYPINSIWSRTDDHHIDNAVLRYHPSFVGGPKSSGFRGGAGQYMERIDWTLIPRSYRLYKGFISIPPTKAKFFKFEFTSLAPRWYEPFIPVVRNVKRFPAGLQQETRRVDGAFTEYPGMTTTLNKVDEFIDRPGLQTTVDPKKPSPTAALFARDPAVAANLSTQTWQYRFVDWRADIDHPAWWQTGPHRYQEIGVLHDDKLAFQVGIKTLQAYRLNFGASDDTMVYRDTLHDLAHIDRSTLSWSARPGYIFSSVIPSIAQSERYNSRHNVQAIQFATQQTPAVQVIPNDDFRDPATARDAQPRRVDYHTDGDFLIVTTYDIDEDEDRAAAARASQMLVSDADDTTVPANALLDGSQSWTTDEWVGFTVAITAGTGVGQERVVVENTDTMLFVDDDWTTPPDNTSDCEIYEIVDTGGVDAATAGSTLTDSDKAWTVDEWIGSRVRITAGTGVGQVRDILSNTADTLTVDSNWSPGISDLDSEYRIETVGDSGTADDLVGVDNVLVDNSQSWFTNQWAGCLVRILSGLGAGQVREISSNSATTLVLTADWDTDPDHTSRYAIELDNYTVVVNASSIDILWAVDQDPTQSWRYFFDIRRPIARWHPIGDARMDHLAHINMVSVSRDLTSAANFVGVGTSFAQPPGNPVMSYRTSDQPQGIDFGGIESPKLVVSPRGTIAAAVRLSTTDVLDEPLRLQIIAADDTTVLAEKVFTPAPGETVEETIEYHIGDNYSDGSYLAFPLRNVVDAPDHPVFMELDPLEPLDSEIAHLFRVRLVQNGHTSNQWKVDRLSLYDESIVWEFSNNGGNTFHEVVGDIRNNPNGLHSFPTRGKSLVWRATAYRNRMALTSIQIRPWYEGFVNYRHTVPQRGGNVSEFDQDPPIDEDPEFRMWHRIVPRHWFLNGMRFPLNSMVLDDRPMITEFQRQFVDIIDETLSTPAAVATRGVMVVRDMPETATATDSMSRSLVMSRDVPEDAPATDTRPEIEEISGTWEIS